MKWSYKTVHFELKKEGLLGVGFLDESEIEQALNEYGKSGWEVISVLEVQDGIIVIFKQPLGLAFKYGYREEEAADDGEKSLYTVSPPEDTIGDDQIDDAAEAAEETSPGATRYEIGAIRIE